MKEQTVLIIGLGHAGAQAAASLRQFGWEGNILMIGEEAYLPYHRPPLSKDLLSGKKTAEQLLIRGAIFYEKKGIQFMLNSWVSKLSVEDQIITLENDEQYAFDKLILATGARARKLDIPGVALPKVHFLRDMKDALEIQASAQESKKAAVVGGGYIGLEVAASLRKMGLEVQLIEATDRILQRVTSPEISEYFEQLHLKNGARIEKNKLLTAIEGTGKIEGIRCQDGSFYPADMVVIGVGIVPNISLAEHAGLEIDNGIIVNEFGQSSRTNIFAAGDCTHHPSHHYGGFHRLESVQNATDQATTVAASICGIERPYNSLPWFWSEQYDTKWQIAGIHIGYDQLVVRGDINTDQSFVAWYLKEGKLIAADCINHPQAFMIARKLIDTGNSINPTELVDIEDLKLLLK